MEETIFVFSQKGYRCGGLSKLFPHWAYANEGQYYANYANEVSVLGFDARLQCTGGQLVPLQMSVFILYAKCGNYI